MKKLLFTILTCVTLILPASADDVTSKSWGHICSGQMGAQWYGTDEAQAIADVLLEVQHANGGWGKNQEYHKLTPAEKQSLIYDRNSQSCLDNSATTQEMRYLAKVWQLSKVEKYRTAFLKALDMIFAAEKSCGGWSQYWPLDGNGSYHDYITFNDNLMTNVMKILYDVNDNKGDFAGIADDATRTKCKAAFDRAISLIIRCQVDDNGTKSAWCAQHDPADLLPAEGRPHELPSISGMESAALLSFLMTIPNPSKELKDCINSAITWLDNHKIADKAIQDYTNTDGEADRRINDQPGNAIWGRFIQFGGATGRTIYTKFFNLLRDRNKKRSYTHEGKTYTYTEEEMARASYREDKAYQPIFSIYSNDYPHLYYRFLYNYADTDPVRDEKGLPIATSLMAGNRRSYQYLGSWCQNVIKSEYPAWKQKIEAQEAAGDATPHELSATTYLSSSEDGQTYYFDGGFSVSNKKGKGYGGGVNKTVKYSACEYTISLPAGLSATKIAFYGYDNYDTDAYLAKVNGKVFEPTDYVFPAKVGGNPNYVTHTIDLQPDLATDVLPFTIGVKQCALIITIYTIPTPSGITNVTSDRTRTATTKRISKRGIVIEHDGKTYNAVGQQIR